MAMRFKDLGAGISLGVDTKRSYCNVRRPQRDIAGKCFKDHEIV
jgi:hypothetical protein